MEKKILSSCKELEVLTNNWVDDDPSLKMFKHYLFSLNLSKLTDEKLSIGFSNRYMIESTVLTKIHTYYIHTYIHMWDNKYPE